MAWLSDFPYEKEYIFINTSLRLKNLWLTQSQLELKFVFEALSRIMIDKFTQDCKKRCDISSKGQEVLRLILQNGYPFNHIDNDYILQMIKVCCEDIHCLHIDVDKIENSIWKYIFHNSFYGSVDVKCINNTFPKLKYIWIRGVKESGYSVGYILNDVLNSWQSIIHCSSIESIYFPLMDLASKVTIYQGLYKSLNFIVKEHELEIWHKSSRDHRFIQ